MDEFEKTLVELEAVITDPVLDKLLVKVRSVNESVKYGPLSTVEALTVVGDLNKEWSDEEFVDKEMHVTGPMYVGKQFGLLEDVSSLEHVKKNYADHPFMAKDFSVVNVVRYEQGVLAYDQEFLLRGLLEVKGSKEPQHCAIVVDQSVLIESKELTPAKVSAWLDSYYPEAKGVIDLAFESAQNEAEATLALADIVYPITFTEKKQRKELRSYLKKYINNRIKYDTYVPYIVKIDGFCGA